MDDFGARAGIEFGLFLTATDVFAVSGVVGH